MYALLSLLGTRQPFYPCDHLLAGAGVARKVYLMGYNIVQWVGFCAVVWVLGKCLFQGYGKSSGSV